MQGLRTTLVAITFQLLTGSAFAETPWDTLVNFGLTGTWARSCSVAPSPSFFWQTFFRDVNGRARVKLDRGPDLPPVTYAIDSATLMTATTLKLINRHDDPNWGSANGLIFDVILMKENSRIRTLESKTIDGTPYAKDGINVSSGQPTAWLEKCQH
jgi:hypothetical protein